MAITAGACAPLKDDIARHAADPGTLVDPADLEQRFEACAQAFGTFGSALAAYDSPEKALSDRLTAVIDAESKTAGWQDLIDLARDPAGLRAELVAAARETAANELTQALRQIDRGNGKVLDDKFADLSIGVLKWWNLLRPEEQSFFSAVQQRPGARRTIDFKAGLAAPLDRSDAKLRDVIAVFSQSQLHCLGLSLFLARCVHENAGFVVLDDPILSSDEDYRAFFTASVVKELADLGIQVIILTQDQKTWKELGERYLHAGISMFQISLEDPQQGTAIRNTADNLAARLARIETLARGAANSDICKQACQELREATERFCKLMLVQYAWVGKRLDTSVTNFDNKNLAELGPRVQALLVKDPSHPGKLRAIRDNLNPANHDDGIPSQGELKVSLGDLKQLKRDYLG